MRFNTPSCVKLRGLNLSTLRLEKVGTFGRSDPVIRLLNDQEPGLAYKYFQKGAQVVAWCWFVRNGERCWVLYPIPLSDDNLSLHWIGEMPLYSTTQQGIGPAFNSSGISKAKLLAARHKQNSLFIKGMLEAIGNVPSSDETQNELAYLDNLIEKTPPLDCSRMELEATNLTSSLCKHLGGDSEKMKKIKLLVEESLLLCDGFTLFAKLHYDRARPIWAASYFRSTLKNEEFCPLVSDKNLPLLNPSHPSFPSGHATQVHTIAKMATSTMTSDECSLIKKWAGDVAKNRELAGLHFPSDTHAGMNLATFLVHSFAEWRRTNNHSLNETFRGSLARWWTANELTSFPKI